MNKQNDQLYYLFPVILQQNKESLVQAFQDQIGSGGNGARIVMNKPFTLTEHELLYLYGVSLPKSDITKLAEALLPAGITNVETYAKSFAGDVRVVLLYATSTTAAEAIRVFWSQQKEGVAFIDTENQQAKVRLMHFFYSELDLIRG